MSDQIQLKKFVQSAFLCFFLNQKYSQAKNILNTNQQYNNEELNLYSSIRKFCETKTTKNKVTECIDRQYDLIISKLAETNHNFLENEI